MKPYTPNIKGVVKDDRIFNVTNFDDKKSNRKPSEKYSQTRYTTYDQPRRNFNDIEKVGVEFSQRTDQDWLGPSRTLGEKKFFKPVYGGNLGTNMQKINPEYETLEEVRTVPGAKRGGESGRAGYG